MKLRLLMGFWALLLPVLPAVHAHHPHLHHHGHDGRIMCPFNKPCPPGPIPGR